MWRKLAQVGAWAVIAFGLALIALTQTYYDSLGEPLLWLVSGFTSGGLVFVSLGLLNVAYLRWGRGEKGFRRIVIIADACVLGLLAALSVELQGDIVPLVALAAVALTGVTTALAKAPRVRSCH